MAGCTIHIHQVCGECHAKPVGLIQALMLLYHLGVLIHQ